MKPRQTIYNSIGLGIAGIVSIVLILNIGRLAQTSSAPDSHPVRFLINIVFALAVILFIGGGSLMNLVGGKLRTKPTIAIIVVYCLTCFLVPMGIWGIIELWLDGERKRRTQNSRGTAGYGRSFAKRSPKKEIRSANISWIGAVIGFVVVVLCGSTHNSGIAFLGAVIGTLGMFASLAFGIHALRYVRDHGKKHILIPALIGITISALFLMFVVAALIVGAREGVSELRGKNSIGNLGRAEQTNNTSNFQ